MNNSVIANQIIKSFSNQHTDEKQIPLILVSTGSYNPVHRMHLEIFEQAKLYLDQHSNYNVIAGIISPSHDDYISRKYGRLYNPQKHNAQHRLEMIRLAIDESKLDWIYPSNYESSQNGFIDYHQIVKDLQQQLIAVGVPKTVRFMYLCGTDHVAKVRYGMFQLKHHGVIAVDRPSLSEFDKTKVPSHILVVPVSNFTSDYNTVSSTEIRQMLKSKTNTMATKIYKSVFDYICTNNLW